MALPTAGKRRGLTVSVAFVLGVIVCLCSPYWTSEAIGSVRNTDAVVSEIRLLASSFPTGFYAALYADPETRHLYLESFAEARQVPDRTCMPAQFFFVLTDEQQVAIISSTAEWLQSQSADERSWHLILMRRWSMVAVQFQILETYLSNQGLLQGLYGLDVTRPAFEPAMLNRGWNLGSIEPALVAETLSSAESIEILFASIDILARLPVTEQARAFSELWKAR